MPSKKTSQERVALLKQGGTAWNEWRRENLDIRPDLRRADLAGANLSDANLSGRISAGRTSGGRTSGGRI